MITVLRAPAYATIQDSGRHGFRRDGVPPGGAMDRFALEAGNTAVGNVPGAAAIECALTGGALRFDQPARFALTGAEVEARMNARRLEQRHVQEARAGDVLTIEHIVRRRFFYVCFAGGVDVPVVLGSRSTFLPGGFGGLEGRRLRAGDVIALGAADQRSATESRPSTSGKGAGAALQATPQRESVSWGSPITLLPGPHADEIDAHAWSTLLGGEYAVSSISDRLGYRLEGPRIATTRAADRLSEPACPGVVQVTPRGDLIVLMVDGPTVGGYPMIAVVASREISRLAQCSPGENIRFRISTGDGYS